MTPPSPNPTPAGGEDELRQRHCIHWFVNKSTLGAPGTAWQECEMCGMKLKDIIAASNQQAVQKARFEEIRLAVKAGAITDTYASMRVAHLAAAQPRKDERGA